MGWFPYLFYSTTWVAEVMATEIGKDPNVDDATRAGVLALLIYSFGKFMYVPCRESLPLTIVSSCSGYHRRNLVALSRRSRP